MAATLFRFLLASTLAQAQGQAQGLEVSPSQSVVHLSDTAATFLSLTQVADTSSVVCFANNTESGVCKQLTVDGDARVSVGSDIAINADATQHVSVTTFGDNGSAPRVAWCYSDVGGVNCRLLDVNSGEMSDPVQVSSEAVNASSISVTSLGDARGLVCFSCDGCNVTDAPGGQCALLTAQFSPFLLLLADAPMPFGNASAAAQISARGFSEDSAVVCYSRAGEGVCTLAQVVGGSTDLTYTRDHVVVAGDSTVSIARLSEDSGVVCFADGEANGNHAACVGLAINGSMLSFGDALRVSDGQSSSVSVASLTSDLAIVCFVGPENEDSPGICMPLSVANSSASAAGAASVVNDEPTARLVLVGLSEDVATMCYAKLDGDSSCKVLSVATAATTSAAAQEEQPSSTAVSGTEQPSTPASTPHAEETTARAAGDGDDDAAPTRREDEDSAAGPRPLLLGSARLLAALLGVGALL